MLLAVFAILSSITSYLVQSGGASPLLLVGIRPSTKVVGGGVQRKVRRFLRHFDT